MYNVSVVVCFVNPAVQSIQLLTCHLTLHMSFLS